MNMPTVSRNNDNSGGTLRRETVDVGELFNPPSPPKNSSSGNIKITKMPAAAAAAAAAAVPKNTEDDMS